MLKFLIKEASVLVAFIVLGALLLVSLWLSHGVNQSILREFRDPKISIIIPEESLSTVRDFLEKDPSVVRYDFFPAESNKAKLMTIYPELANVVRPLELKFFPNSAVVTVKNVDIFQKSLAALGIVQKQIVHEPPEYLGQFLRLLSFVLLALWILTLSLVLYFNVERATIKQEARWSLMKMLGARPMKLFLELWYGQSLRVLIASGFAILLGTFACQQVGQVFAWNWADLPWTIWAGFFLLSLALTWGISFILFHQRYRRISLG